jgi:hypothetical protein
MRLGLAVLVFGVLASGCSPPPSGDEVAQIQQADITCVFNKGPSDATTSGTSSSNATPERHYVGDHHELTPRQLRL